MKVDLIKLKFGEEESYKIKSIDWCCSKLKQNPAIELHYGDINILSACEDCPNASNDLGCCKYDTISEECPRINSFEESVDEDGNYIGMIFHKERLEHDGEYNDTQDEYYPIHYCPHCGEKIDVNTVESIDVTEIYRKLESKINELSKEYNQTDSKKKSRKLQDQIRNLDRKMNDFYEISEYKPVEI